MAHTCHATGCSVPVPPELLMCPPHWRLVPYPLRRAVWHTYRSGQCDDMQPSVAYLNAAKAAVEWVARQEGRVPDTRLYDAMGAHP